MMSAVQIVCSCLGYLSTPFLLTLPLMFLLIPAARAQVQSPKLVPSTTFTVVFPDMPPTFYALKEKKNVPAQMTIYLPKNYDAHKKHPLLVFLYGGSGEDGTKLGITRGICQDRDLICLAVPLFKSKELQDEYIMRNPDGRYMWPFFRRMLEKTEELVPNIDKEHRVLGGFSNGAHAAQALLDESGGEVARRFCAFLFVEGGGRLQQYELLKGKPFLMVSSNSKSRRRAQEIADAAKAAGADASFLFEDVGKHDFPRSAYPSVGEWLRRVASIQK